MTHVTITAHGETVQEALRNARSTAMPLRPGSQLMLDGITRPIMRGDIHIGNITATADSEQEKLDHYTGKDLMAVPEAGF